MMKRQGLVVITGGLPRDCELPFGSDGLLLVRVVFFPSSSLVGVMLFPSYICDTPKPGCPLTTRQPAEYSWISGNLPDIHENRAESPLYGELYPNTKPVPNSSQ